MRHLMGMIFTVLCLLFLLSTAEAVTRFESEQLEFVLTIEGQNPVDCQHTLMKSVTPYPAPPWWIVKCGDREYTVDVWMEQKAGADGLERLVLLYHAKEGTASSGKKMTQFETQVTRFIFQGEAKVRAIQSSIDVRNGLADLNVTAVL